MDTNLNPVSHIFVLDPDPDSSYLYLNIGSGFMSSDTDRHITQIHILLYKIVPQILISQIALIMFINLLLQYLKI